MKQKIILLLLLFTGICFNSIQAQIKQVTIVDELEIYVAGEGFIKISCDPKIKELIGVNSPEISEDKDNSITTNGYRIQVFMSNDPKTARKESSEKRSLIKEAFSDIFVYEDYNAPNFKLLAGDFLSKEEADVFKQRLLKAIPQLGKEMYVVQSKIKISMQRRY